MVQTGTKWYMYQGAKRGEKWYRLVHTPLGVYHCTTRSAAGLFFFHPSA